VFSGEQSTYIIRLFSEKVYYILYTWLFMVYLPYYETLIGTKHPQNPLPSIGDDEGTAFAVGVIPVEDNWP
jgi:hypothetical protein